VHLDSGGAAADLDADIATVRGYADATYAPDAAAWLANGTLPPADHLASLVAFTGLGTATWQQQFDMDFDTFRHQLIADTTLGVYDGRMSALVGTPLDADDDPSNSFVAPGFQSGIDALLPALGYTNPSTYVMASNAIATWNFSHGGRALPDGLTFVASYVSADLGRCFQLMETDDVTLFQRWIADWQEVVEFEVVPVVEGKTTREALAPML